MRISIMQPTYLPWMGYFELMHNCDLFVFLDDVQFVRKSWQHRNKIKTASGEILLTVPVFSKGKRVQQITEVEINNQLPWRRKHLSTIRTNYCKAKYFDTFIDELERIYCCEYRKLLMINLTLIRFLCTAFGISTPTVQSSTLNTDGVGSQKIVNICKALKADVLYDTQGAKSILDAEHFKANQIELIFQRYRHPTYSQLHGDFISHLSALDLLLNEGGNTLGSICAG